MSFLDHLEELRWHIIRSVAAILVFSIGAYLVSGFIWDEIIFGPTRTDFWTFRKLCALAEKLNSPALCIGDFSFEIQNRQITGQFLMDIKSSFVIGLILTFPYAFWEIWRFVKPGLKNHEKRASRGVVFVVSVLFTSGVLFGYFIVTPLSINFLANYKISNIIENNIDITSLLALVATLALACGLMFQLPVVTYILSKAGIITPGLMKTYRRHAIIVILVISAMITPPDLISQLLIEFPLILLYEVSIMVSARIQRKIDRD